MARAVGKSLNYSSRTTDMTTSLRSTDVAWQAIFDRHNIHSHNFIESPYEITAEQIKEATQHFTAVGQREVRVLCKQDERESRPLVFQENDLFILPIRNGRYVIVQGEGYLDIPLISEVADFYQPKLTFPLITSGIGDSEMQHLDFAYATSVVRSFMGDDSLVLTIRGRKYTPRFDFRVGKHRITAESVQTEIDAGYEGKSQVVLIEAKRPTTNTIIRQLYYPFRQWHHHVVESEIEKKVSTVFFENNGNDYSLWLFEFHDFYDYNSIQLVRHGKYRISNTAR